MHKTALLVVLVATAAWAGEKLLGIIVVTDGGSGTNYSSGGTANVDGVLTSNPLNLVNGTRCNTGFEIGAPGTLITIQTDEGCFCGVDVVGCDAGQCLKLAADEKFPTSVKRKITFADPSWNWDGGSAAPASACAASHTGTRLACAPPIGGAACHARVFSWLP